MFRASCREGLRSLDSSTRWPRRIFSETVLAVVSPEMRGSSYEAVMSPSKRVRLSNPD